MNEIFLKGLLIFTVLAVTLGLGPTTAARSTASPTPATTLTAPGPQIVVLLDNRYIPHRVLPPALPDRAADSATFQINWNPSSCDGSISPWSNEAKNAFNYAVNIWAGLLESDRTIVVDACWRSDLGPGVLGAAGTTTIHRDFSGAPVAGTWYPAALANALSGSDQNNSDTAEINANFSSTFDWYYGTDGNTPYNKVDFVSVVLHELGHGLGFYGMGNVTAGLGSVKYYGYPGIYDRFTEDGDGTPLLNYLNYSLALGNALTGKVGGGVYFNGTHANAANGDNRVKLYSPSPWQSGSSYSHLDEIFNGTPNALMTYSLGYGESEHSPGPVMLGMFEDMGWTVAYSPAPAPTVTSVSPNSGSSGSSIAVTITGSDFRSGATVKLTRTGETDIPGTAVNVVGESQITCNFSLIGAATGAWDVVVTNSDGQSGKLVSGFTVTEPPAPDVAISGRVVGHDFQLGDSITFSLSVANIGSATANYPLVVDYLPAGITEAGYAGDLSITFTGNFSFAWNLEPLAVGEQGVITVYGRLAPTATLPLVNWASISDPADDSPENNITLVIVGGHSIYLPLTVRGG